MDALTLPDQLDAAVRAALFAVEFAAAGLGWFLVGWGTALRASLPRLRSLTRASALASLPLLLLHAVLQPARMAGDFSGLADTELLQMSLLSANTAAVAVQLAGVLLLLTALRSARPAGNATLLAVGAVAIAAGFLLVGHSTSSPRRPLVAALLLLHLLAAQFWVGALVALPALVRLEASALAAPLVERFSQRATWLVPLIPLAGLLLTALLLPDLSVLQRPYGYLLLAKAGLTALAFALAAANRWRLGPALVDGAAESRAAFRGAVLVETAVVALVLACAAVLTTWFSPE